MKTLLYLARAIHGEVLIAVAVVLGLVGYAHCGLVSKPPSNAFGAMAYAENPNVYLYGSIITGSILVDKPAGRYATNIRFNPAHTFSLFSETVLFCGNVSQQFEGMTGPLVITYRRTAHLLYQGVACHELESVDRVESKEEIP